jgi:hypothetical protein
MIRSLAVGIFFFGTIPLSVTAEPGSTVVASDSVAVPDSLANTNVFHSEGARIEIQKPATWHFVDIQSVVKHGGSVKLDDEAFLDATKKMGKRPLVAATKHEASYTGLNPSFQLIVRPAANQEGKSGVELLQLYIPRLSQAFTGFKVVTAPYAITVAGRPGGRLDVSYAITGQDGKTLPSTSTLVLVPQGKVVYQVGFSYPPEGPDKLTKEIDEILGSVKWLD